MYGAHVCNLKKPHPLFTIERANHFNLPLNPIQFARLRFAILAIFSMNLLVHQANHDSIQRQGLPVRIHPQRDRGAGSQCRQQVVVRIRPGVGTAEGNRFIGKEVLKTLEATGELPFRRGSTFFRRICALAAAKRL